MLKTTVILTKIWFFSVNYSASRKPLHHAAAVINCIGSFSFINQCRQKKKKDNYSVCLNVAIFKNKKSIVFFYILIYSEPEYIV